MIINSLLDLDFYKLTQSWFAYKRFPDEIITYKFTNRSPDQKLAEIIPLKKLQQEIFAVQPLRFSTKEIDYLRFLNVFNEDFLFFLYTINSFETLKLPTPIIRINGSQFEIEVTGKWPLAIFWETIILSIVNELYSDEIEDIKDGYGILGQKIEKLATNSNIKIVEFGTRRRYSRLWQEMVLKELRESKISNQIVGTSNVSLAKKFNITPFGTFAHEMPMICSNLMSGKNLNKDSQNKCFDLWYETLGKQFSIALTDTFTSKFFFESFGKERAEKWKGLRHDSGNPFAFGEQAIKFYENYGIDPKTKRIVFSDGLNVDVILELQKYFEGKIDTIYGWGTNLTNDVGIKPLSIVMKATHVNGQEIVKLSDNEGKHSGSLEAIEKYKKVFLN